MNTFQGCTFQLHTYLQERSTASVRKAQQRVRNLIHEKERERSGIDGLPPADGYPFSLARPAQSQRTKPSRKK